MLIFFRDAVDDWKANSIFFRRLLPTPIDKESPSLSISSKLFRDKLCESIRGKKSFLIH